MMSEMEDSKGRVMAVQEKIEDLFSCRGVTSLAKGCLNAEEFAEWEKAAVDIQRRIYLLDEFYEEHKDLGGEAEECLWKVFSEGGKEWGAEISGAVGVTYEELKKYGEYEARLHCGETVDDSEWRAISWLKSSDVFLARSIVWDFSSKSTGCDTNARHFFRVYDEFFEVIEDLYDLREDVDNWNLNFWLTPLRCGEDPRNTFGRTLELARVLISELEGCWSEMSVKQQCLFRKYWLEGVSAWNSLWKGRNHLFRGFSNLKYIPYSEMPADSGLVQDEASRSKVALEILP